MWQIFALLIMEKPISFSQEHFLRGQWVACEGSVFDAVQVYFPKQVETDMWMEWKGRSKD